MIYECRDELMWYQCMFVLRKKKTKSKLIEITERCCSCRQLCKDSSHWPISFNHYINNSLDSFSSIKTKPLAVLLPMPSPWPDSIHLLRTVCPVWKSYTPPLKPIIKLLLLSRAAHQQPQHISDSPARHRCEPGRLEGRGRKEQKEKDMERKTNWTEWTWLRWRQSRAVNVITVFLTLSVLMVVG